jgi:cadmium resistance protein CadD (predicted permease)
MLSSFRVGPNLQRLRWGELGMSPAVAVLAASVTTFAATNLDDIFLLTVFFARRVPPRRVIAGQYLGFAVIVAVSIAAAGVVGFTIPRAWIRLLGLLPMGIGLKELFQMHTLNPTHVREPNGSLGVLSVAAATLANGADNIGIYVPFFLVNRTHLPSILAVYGLLVFVWCVAARWLGSHPVVLKTLDRWGHWVVPFVLVVLGMYILLFT